MDVFEGRKERNEDGDDEGSRPPTDTVSALDLAPRL